MRYMGIHHLQLELIGNWKFMNFGIDFAKLIVHNPDIVFEAKDKLIFKDINLPFKYPHEIKFYGNHFVSHGEGLNRRITFNPSYMGIFCSRNDIRTTWKIVGFDRKDEGDGYIRATCWASAHGKPLIIDYKYKNEDMGAIARYVGTSVVECIIDYFNDYNEATIFIYAHQLYNGRVHTKLFEKKDIEAMSIVKGYIEEHPYRSLIEHTFKNVLTDSLIAYGVYSK